MNATRVCRLYHSWKIDIFDNHTLHLRLMIESYRVFSKILNKVVCKKLLVLVDLAELNFWGFQRR